MADKLLAAHNGTSVGKNWSGRFMSYMEELKMAFNGAKDCQKVLQEDPKVISAWFELVQATITKYSVYNNDIHNFDEMGFQMGVIGFIKVVTGLERHIRPNLIQSGDWEWVTVIQNICTAGYMTPPFIIYKGRVHISAGYEEADILYNWKLLVFENSWINNELSLKGLKHFNKHIKVHQVGLYKLLILDGHESHFN